MNILYLGTYTIFIILIWAFFIVARLHAYKFRSFSTYIVPVTRILFLLLLFLTVSGFLVILFGFIGGKGGGINSESRVIDMQSVEEKDKYKDLDFNDITY